MHHKPINPWRYALNYGLIGGGTSLLIALVGMVAAFNKRYIINGVITMGQVLLLAPILLTSYTVSNRLNQGSKPRAFVAGVLSGAISGAILTLFVALGQVVNLRSMFINASPDLYKILTFGVPMPLGIFMPIVIGAITSVLGAGLALLPDRLRLSAITALMWVLLLGMTRDLIFTVIQRWGPVKQYLVWMFANSGLTPLGAVVVFVVMFALYYWNSGRTKRIVQRTPNQQRARRSISILVIGIVLLTLPLILGIFFSEILDNSGIYILMGLGLNIVVGYAGLLDLGYVAFFAIGAYTMGVLTSPELAANPMTFWQALPFALVMCFFAGLILGLPVLRMRGDYLAIVTLGFGEIIRLIVLSDWLKAYLGGTQGIQGIAQPQIGSFVFNTQQSLYYLILIGIGVVAFVAWRLKDSHMGRSWMAMREDEDVAQAMGINLVTTKLLAFATGALFSGLGGVLFATKLTSAYPSSFGLLVSITVLSIIIVGGMGSIPGVFVGALVLIGLPDLLREFAEYRYLVYGAALVAIMLIKPEGLWPEQRRKLELHEPVTETVVGVEEMSPAATFTEVPGDVE